MSKNLKTEAVDHLFDAILCLKDRAECYTFFEDVCTINELLSLSMLYVSSGIGGSFPFRLGAWPELTVITLKRDI